MTRQVISRGTAANDGSGDTLRDAAQKINQNFEELYLFLGGDSDNLSPYLGFTDSAIIFTDSSYDLILTNNNLTANRTIRIPDISDTLVTRSSTDTLTNKTLTSAILTTPLINDLSSDHRYTIKGAELAGNRNINLPILTDSDTFVFQAHTQTLTNKSLTSPTITTPKLVTAINDANGAELIKFTATASAVNEITLANAALADAPTITATGDATNININLAGKGTGSIRISKGAYESQTIISDGAASTSVSYIIGNKASPLALTLANGTTVGEFKKWSNSGSGLMTVTPTSFGPGTSFTVGTNRSCETIWDGSKWQLIGRDSDYNIRVI